jgi:hypothetical protein
MRLRKHPVSMPAAALLPHTADNYAKDADACGML